LKFISESCYKMNLFSIVKRFFSPGKQDSEPTEVAVSDYTVPGSIIPIPLTNTSFPPPDNPEADFPHWLAEEDALRDEGVIFGLSDASAEEKIKIIETMFAEKMATDLKKAELLSEQIGEINLKMSQLEEQLNTRSKKIDSYEQAQKMPHQLPKAMARLILSVLMATGNFFLIDNVFTDSFPQNHFFISAGVFLAGMFTVFAGSSVLHENTGKLSVLSLIRELALPVSASVFVWTIAAGSMSGIRAFGLFVFVLSLFLYSGKLLLESLGETKDELATWLHNRRIQTDKKQIVSALELDIETLRIKTDELRIEKWKIIPELSEAEGRISQWNNQRDSRIHLFESEFKLARSYREKLSRSQLKRIME
jgi:hypothetical protein